MPSLYADTLGELSASWHALNMDGKRVSREDLRQSARRVGAEARRRRWLPEQLLVAAKQALVVPPTHDAATRRSVEAMRTDLLSLCIVEFYRETDIINLRRREAVK